MSKKRQSPTQPAPDYAHEYAKAKDSILQLGYFTEGSLVQRFITCGQRSCQCHENTDKRHGPYYQLTWKRKGKTISQFISPSLAECYKEWIGNRRALTAILKSLQQISEKAIDAQLSKIEDLKDKSILLNVKEKLHKT